MFEYLFIYLSVFTTSLNVFLLLFCRFVNLSIIIIIIFKLFLFGFYDCMVYTNDNIVYLCIHTHTHTQAFISLDHIYLFFGEFFRLFLFGSLHPGDFRVLCCCVVGCGKMGVYII
ncbi:hypothetical protein T440DRAFT_320000 [Plenodomus tracheiphilus IPT5]|uniref:Uncharacterized protein n=1 Tax=Plenodomus tracheiphilus IPT5 TaxID=1408161 RepID=A0A6A7BD26_9PLEO|nr:hypothetical protein T440DRAFT_320000 [Plenodomus tracheiphilus IPT5]